MLRDKNGKIFPEIWTMDWSMYSMSSFDIRATEEY